MLKCMLTLSNTIITRRVNPTSVEMRSRTMSILACHIGSSMNDRTSPAKSFIEYGYEDISPATHTTGMLPGIWRLDTTGLKLLLEKAILLIKRTFQPSLIRRKRKHGFLKRIATKDGRAILNHRRSKGRKSLCP